MAKVYRNVLVPVPDDAYISKTDGRVYVVLEKIYNVDKQYNEDKRASIGKAAGLNEKKQNMMYPNEYFRFLHPDIFNAYCTDDQSKVPIVTLIIGPYVALLAIAQKNTLYQIMIRVFGPQHANASMDYAMYSIIEHSNVSKDLKPVMASYLLFSDRAYSDSWYSDLFTKGISEEQIRLFKDKWIKYCIGTDDTEGWVCIDGSNDDCDAKENHDAEHGHGKSGTSGNIVSYMWAVSAKDGTPISFEVYRGGRVDSKQVLQFVEYLQAAGIKVKGFLLDRGFCTNDVITMMQKKNYAFIILATSDTYVYQEMMKQHGKELRLMTAEDMLDRSGIYGVTHEEKIKVFSSHKTEVFATLVYDSTNAVARINALTDHVKEIIATANESVLNGKKPSIEKEYKKYVKEAVTEDGYVFYVPNAETIQEATEEKGFSCMISSFKYGASETDNLYTLRQASEKQYCTYKTQLGNDVMRVHATRAWESKSCVEFIAAILRTQFENECISLHYDTNQMMREMCLLTMSQYPERGYQYVHTENKRQITLLKELGINIDDLPEIARAENERLNNPIHSPIHQLPQHEQVRKKPGRPKGSKNLKPKQKTVKRKKKRGRPKGSKNKSTLEKEAKTKRGPGRPKGSLNKKSKKQNT